VATGKVTRNPVHKPKRKGEKTKSSCMRMRGEDFGADARKETRTTQMAMKPKDGKCRKRARQKRGEKNSKRRFKLTRNATESGQKREIEKEQELKVKTCVEGKKKNRKRKEDLIDSRGTKKEKKLWNLGSIGSQENGLKKK